MSMTTLAETEVKFLPHMAIHMNKGCQQNSSCTTEIGKVNLEWNEVLKSRKQSQLNKFQKKYGLPVSFWTTEKENKSMVTFDSRCSKHRVKDNEIYEAMMFIKSSQELLKNKNILPNIAIRQRDGKSYFVPRKSLPILLKDDALVFNQDHEGAFYTLHVSSKKKNNYKATFKTPTAVDIKESQCPKELREKFISKLTNQRQYQSTYCKDIWNQNTKSYERFIFGWSCLWA